MTATLDQPVKAPTFHPVSAGRKLKNNIATTLFTASFVVAMIPLVWLIYTVLAKGITAIPPRRGGATPLPACCRRRWPAVCITRSTAP